MRGHGSQWISHKMNNWHPWQLKKSETWEPFCSYQLNSTADLANLAQFWGKWAGLAVLFSSKTAPRILIFSIAMGADYSFYVKTIETHARTFLALNILAIDRVERVLAIFNFKTCQKWQFAVKKVLSFMFQENDKKSWHKNISRLKWWKLLYLEFSLVNVLSLDKHIRVMHEALHAFWLQ